MPQIYFPQASAGTQAQSSALSFVNSNSITFGMSNSNQITASYAQSQITAGNNVTLSQVGSTVTIQGPVFSNSNNVTFGQNAGTITASVNGAGVAIGAGGQSVSTGSVNFLNSNGITFGMSNSSQITASYAQSQITAGANITLSQVGSTITIIGASGGAGAAASAGSQLQTSGTVQFVNSNSITFGMSNYSQITASYAQSQITAGANITLSQIGSTITIIGGAGGAGAAASAGSQLQTSGTVQFVNANNVSFGMSNSSQITATATFPAQTVQPVAASASNGSYNFSTLKFVEGSGLTWATQANGIQASVRTDYASSSHSHGNPTLNLTNITGTTASASNGLTLSLSGNAAQTVQPVAYAVGGTTNNFSTLPFANSNGVTFSTGTQGVFATVKTDYQSSNANYLTSQSNQALSGSNGSFTFQTASFGNLNSMSFYTSNGSVVGSYAQSQITAGANVTLSQAGSTITIIAGGGGIAAGLSTLGNTAGNTGTYSTGTLVFAASNSATLSLSTGGANVRTLWFLPLMMAISGGPGISLYTTNGSQIVIRTVTT